MTTDNPVSGTDTDLPTRQVQKHHRRNHDETDDALIRMEGLIYALEVVADELRPGTSGSDKEWSAFHALTGQLDDHVREIWRLRRLEWVGIGGKADGMTEADIAIARGEA